VPVFAFVLGITFILMLTAFRSIVIAATTIVLNLLSVAAAYGAMVAVFAVFGTLSLQQFKQLSVGLAVAVLLDATVVRGVLLPSAMALLADRNSYLPRWLSRLPPTPPPETPGQAGPGTRPAAPEPTPAGRA